jgi:hypothetical protein
MHGWHQSRCQTYCRGAHAAAGANDAAYTASLPQLCERATEAHRVNNLREMLPKPESAKAAAKWFVMQEVLEQFNTAREIEAEDAAQYVPFQELDSWT